MLTDAQLELLQVMAQQLEERWSICPPSEEPDVADIFAKVCQAITQFDQSVDQWAANYYIFIQIGNEFINQSGRGDIIRGQIIEEERYTDGRIMYPKRLKVVLREIEGSEVCGSHSASKRYEFDSTEGQALFKWLTEHSEVLVPYANTEEEN